MPHGLVEVRPWVHILAMQVTRSDIADFIYVLAIARHLSFRRAAQDLGVSASALSHALKGLEGRLGVRLINRTNRSVMLTAAGEELCAAITGPFDRIAEAVEALNRYRDAPAGRIRLNVVSDAARLLLGPVMPTFVERYPDVDVEVTATNRMMDVTGEGYDAGIRYGGTVPEDMIAVRLSADVRWLVAASPTYLARFGTPQVPEDLQHHRCLQIRLGDDRLYRWEFMRNGVEFALAVPGSVTFNETGIGLEMLRQGGGLMYAAQPVLAPLVASGEARFVLEDWATEGLATTSIIPADGSCPPVCGC